MITRHKLKNGLPNWDVLDPLIIAARKGGSSLADIMATMKLSKSRASGRLSHLASIGMIDPSRSSTARRTTDEEERIVAAEYPEGDTSDLAKRLGVTMHKLAEIAKKVGVRRSASARSSQCRDAALRTAPQRLATMREEDDEEDAIAGRRKLLRHCATGQIFLLENGATLHRSWRDDAEYARYLSSRRTA
jgi:hypothetical protein